MHFMHISITLYVFYFRLKFVMLSSLTGVTVEKDRYKVHSAIVGLKNELVEKTEIAVLRASIYLTIVQMPSFISLTLLNCIVNVY
ncbi:hypothetical protein BDF20DRAFT_855143 [Mycotypha africana]|uniref:uncharacterized protein n=1 Tax=Mycotypha africana TaxID=64632 RepID=UPI002301854D|nr:uncharacterized protein BDF20DRAFT_855143 [Mycotypha africana]KAI8988324.1 hypothetical protein BDF20DRAFT_855143 [Mycotypha africana]